MEQSDSHMTTSAYCELPQPSTKTDKADCHRETVMKVMHEWCSYTAGIQFIIRLWSLVYTCIVIVFFLQLDGQITALFVNSQCKVTLC